jgi:hypothetical protein
VTNFIVGESRIAARRRPRGCRYVSPFQLPSGLSLHPPVKVEFARMTDVQAILIRFVSESVIASMLTKRPL